MSFAIIDIVVAVLLLVFGIYGVVKGFARQILWILSFFFAIIAGFFLLKKWASSLPGSIRWGTR